MEKLNGESKVCALILSDCDEDDVGYSRASSRLCMI